MIGTPKKIEWAEQIRTRFLGSILPRLRTFASSNNCGATVDFVGVLGGLEEVPTDPMRWRVFADAFDEGGNLGRIALDRVAEILEHDSAHWWIENRDWLEWCLLGTLAKKSVSELEKK